MIDLKTVHNVCFHYDKDAPITSKKINMDNLEESRFDVYAAGGRIYHLKAD